MYSAYLTQSISALRVSPTTRFARIEGSPCGKLAGACDRSASATPSLRSVAAYATLVLVVLFIWTADRIDSPGRSLRSRFAIPSGRSTGRPVRPGPPQAPKGRYPAYCLSLGEEEPGREGAREGDTRLSPGAMKGRGSGNLRETVDQDFLKYLLHQLNNRTREEPNLL